MPNLRLVCTATSVLWPTGSELPVLASCKTLASSLSLRRARARGGEREGYGGPCDVTSLSLSRRLLRKVACNEDASTPPKKRQD